MSPTSFGPPCGPYLWFTSSETGRDQVGGFLEATHIERGKARFRKGAEIPFSSTLSAQSCTSEMPVLVWPKSSVRAWN